MSSAQAALTANQKKAGSTLPSLANASKTSNGYFNLPKVSGNVLGASASSGLARMRFS